MKISPRNVVVLAALLAFLAIPSLGQAQVLTFEEAKQRADQGDAFAQAVVALHYQLGWQTEKDVAAAARYALASANAGHPYGLFRLGSLYISGDGVEKNPDLGYRLQLQSSQGLMQLAQNRAKPDPYAMTAVGIANFQGKVTPLNRERAAEWYRAAASYDFAPAVFNYIMCEIEGHGLPQHTATYHHFVRQIPNGGAGCNCASCNGIPALSKSVEEILADYPPAQHYIAKNIGKVEEEARAALALHGAPALEDEYYDGKKDPETLVYERPSLVGTSARWSKLLTASDKLDVYVRANYTGIAKASDPSVSLQGGQLFPFVSCMDVRGGLFSNLQFTIAEADQGLKITPNSPLAKKNRMGLHEYPIALEFKVTNRARVDVPIESLGFEVVQSVVKEESLPGLIFEDDRDDNTYSIAVHNFGWSTWGREVDAILGLWDPSQNLAEYKSIKLLANKPTRVPLKDLKYSPLLEDTLEAHPEYANGRIMSLEAAGTKAWFEPNFSRNAKDFYTRVDGDVRLPAGRGGYRLLFDVKRTLKAGETVVLNASFDFDKSASAMLIPFVATDGQTFTGPEIACEYECLNHYYNPPNTTFAHDGNGDRPVGDVQEALLGISPQEHGQVAPEKLRALTSSLARQIVIKPRMQSVANVVVDENSAPGNVLLEVEGAVSDGRSLSLTGCLSGTTINGRATLSDGSDKKTVFRVPWSFDDVPVDTDAVRISATRGFSDQWFAWLISVGSRTRIYLAFPGKNATVYAPYSLEVANEINKNSPVFVGRNLEDAISRIGRDELGGSLIIEAAGARHLLPLGSRIVPLLQETIHAEGMGVLYLDQSDMADCSRLGLKIPSAIYNGAVTWSESQEVQIPKCVQDAIQVTGILWPDPDTVAVRKGEGWDLWRLHAGSVEQASADAASGFDAQVEQSRTKAAQLLSKINRPREPESRQDLDPRVAGAFVVDTDAELLLVGQEGNLGGLAGPNRILRSSLAIECYSKKAINSWPARRLILNPSGVRKQFAEVSDFFLEIALSPDRKRAVAVTKSGNSLYILDLESSEAGLRWAAGLGERATVASAVRSTLNPRAFSLVLEDGSYLSGNGSASGLVISDGYSVLNLSQLEAKHNRPDKVLEKLLAPKDLISEAKRLRERFLRRSDFKSFEGAALIDIPVVTVKTEVPEKTGDKSLTLDFEASNSTGPLKELRVFNNGALVKTLELTGKDGQPSREASGDVEIDLASGENRLQLMAVSEEGFTSAFAEKRVECTAEPDSRRCFIATVGVSEYNDPRFNLKFAAKDAEDMSKALAEKAQHRGYQPEVMVVKNAEVDGALVGKLREFLAKASTDDEVVLFFAGHGLLDKNLEYHFALHDTDFDATENMGITFQELESLVDGIKPLKRTVLFDTCHSGEVEEEDKQQLLAMVGSGDLGAAAATDAGVQVRGVATRGMKVKELEPKLRHTDFVELESLFPDSRRAKGANILTSSSGSEFSMESDAWQNGLFTFAFLNALKDEKTDANGDKSVSFSEAAAAVQDKVKTLSGGHQRPITRGVNREAEVALASFGPSVAPIPTKENKSGWWPF